jgi:hypothetical protein
VHRPIDRTNGPFLVDPSRLGPLMGQAFVLIDHEDGGRVDQDETTKQRHVPGLV